MEFTFEAVVRLTLENKEGSNKSKHVATDFFLEVDEPLDRKEYLDKDNLPTKAGSHALSNVLIQGLVGNIHFAHDSGFKDSAEHLRWIISELERGFVSVVTVTQSKFKE